MSTPARKRRGSESPPNCQASPKKQKPFDRASDEPRILTIGNHEISFSTNFETNQTSRLQETPTWQSARRRASMPNISSGPSTSGLQPFRHAPQCHQCGDGARHSNEVEDIQESPDYIVRDRRAHIKLENADPTECEALPGTDLKSGAGGLQFKIGKVGDRSRDICNLFSKRKEHLAKAERLTAKIRQAQLTYAEMERRKNKLEQALRNVRNQLEADEQQLKQAKEHAEATVGQIEQQTLELRDICLEA